MFSSLQCKCYYFAKSGYQLYSPGVHREVEEADWADQPDRGPVTIHLAALAVSPEVSQNIPGHKRWLPLQFRQTFGHLLNHLIGGQGGGKFRP